MTIDAVTAAEPADEVAASPFRQAITAFADVASALSDLTDIDDVLHLVARKICDLVGVERCSIHLRDEKAGLYRGHVGQAGEEILDAHVKRFYAGMPADGMTLELLATKRPVIIANAQTDPRIVKSTVRFWNIRSIMAVPMVFKEDVIGIVYLDDEDRPHTFTAMHQAIASAFGDLAAVAIAHSQETCELRSQIDAANRQNSALRRSTAVDERLSDLVLQGRTLQELLDTLAEVLGKPCAVYDRHNCRLATASPGGTEDGIVPRLLDPPYIDMPEVRSALEADPQSRGFVVGPLPSAGVLRRFLVAPILESNKRWGTLLVMEHKTRFAGGDMLTIRRAATLIALQMSTERKAIEADWNAGASLATELLGGSADMTMVRRRAERLGVNLTTPHVVTLISARDSGPAAMPDFRAVAAAFRNLAPGLAVYATTVGDGIAAIMEKPDSAQPGAFVEATKDLLSRARADLGASDELVAAISTVRSDVAGYAEAYVEVRQVVQCVKRFSPPGSHSIFAADDLGATRLFLATSDPQIVGGFAQSTFGALVDDPSKLDLLTTLCAFFDNMANIRRCAARFDVHENTIRYRLARIEELTGLAVAHDPEAQLRARMSLVVLMLQGRLSAVLDEGARAIAPRALALVSTSSG